MQKHHQYVVMGLNPYIPSHKTTKRKKYPVLTSPADTHTWKQIPTNWSEEMCLNMEEKRLPCVKPEKPTYVKTIL